MNPTLRVVAIGALIAGLGSAFAEDVRPNIIYLMADDQNFNSMGIYGNTEVKTPEMDKLGKDGVIFDRHYANTAICMASRANVLTGMYEYKTGTNFFHDDMSPEIWAKSYPVLLREAGYFTGFAGKFGLDVKGLGKNGNAGLPEGDFDVWGGGPGQTSFDTKKNPSMAKYAEEYPHSTLSYGAFGKDFIRQAVGEKKPFCLSISFKAPHKPAQPDPKFDDVYAGKTFTKPENFGRENGKQLAPQSRTSREYAQFTEWKYDTDYNGEMRKYYQQIYAIDVAIGMIREELEAQGIAENTVIIYTSDNGYACGVHGFASKELPYEEASRIPLMIYDPRSPNAGKGLRSEALTGNIDFHATIMELAGLPVPENVDGVSLLPLLENPDTDVREQMVLMNLFGPESVKCMSVMTKDTKYVYWWYGNSDMEPTEELFRVDKDPLEMTNLAANPESAPVLSTMRKIYDAEVSRWKDQAVPMYQAYATSFDRNIPISEKKTANEEGSKKKEGAGKKKEGAGKKKEGAGKKKNRAAE
ncbi:MAG: sulfatase [Luteolibacter sp.]